MRFFKHCECEPEEVSPSSPARALAQSLTDPETRDEWTRKYEMTDSIWGFRTCYENKSRNIVITSNAYGTSTPFTLTEAETAIVEDALKQFDARIKSQAEQDALARLLAAPVRGKTRQRAD